MDCYVILICSLISQGIILLSYQRYTSKLEKKIHDLNENQQKAYYAACNRYEEIIKDKDDLIVFLKEALDSYK